MATKHVQKTGSADSGSAGPFLTISYGLTQIASGDTLYVHVGTYDESIGRNEVPDGTGTSWADAVLTSIVNFPGDTVWLAPAEANTDGGRVVWLSVGESYIAIDGINIDGTLVSTVPVVLGSGGSAHHIRFANLEVIGSPEGRSSSTITGGDDCQILDCEIHGGGEAYSDLLGTDSSNYAWYSGGSGNLIDGCDIYDLKSLAMQIYGGACNNNTIRNNLIHHTVRSGHVGGNIGGILIAGGDNNQVYNNIIYSNGTAGGDATNYGISVYGGATNTKIWNNTVYNNYHWAVTIASNVANYSVTLQNNIFYGNPSGTISNNGVAYIADHNITVNPGFVNAAGGDFRITTTSPAYAAGTPVGLVTDIDGVAYGTPPSVGAHEVGSVVTGVVRIGENSTDTVNGTTIDTQISQELPTTNIGNGTQIGISKYTPSYYVNSLIRFDLSSRSGQTVVAATLKVYYEWGSAVNNTITIYRLLRNWTELGATWNTYDGTNAWGTAGALNTTTDRVVTSSGSVVLSGVVYGYYAITSAQLIADVQDMINTPGTNYGWVITRTDAADDFTYKVLASSEAVDGWRPYLDLAVTGVPTTQAPFHPKPYPLARQAVTLSATW